MDEEEIIRMAREAGLFTHKEVQPELERFANLVAAAEREACAELCEERGMVKGGEVFSARIRARTTP